MSEHHRPREIQLTSKQLVFVFMSTVLVAVIVFLLGVWVGRGIDTGSMAATEAAVGGSASKSGGVPPATAEPKPLTYPDSLTGGASGSAPPGYQPPSTPAAPPDPPSNPPPSEKGPAASDKTPLEKAPPVNEKAAPPVSKPPATASDERMLQVGAYSARAGANKVASDFKAKGYPVTITAGPTFKVLLGPYPAKTAQEIAARLRKEGQDVSVIPRR